MHLPGATRFTGTGSTRRSTRQRALAFTMSDDPSSDALESVTVALADVE